ncbi:RluA family pseudouridine synthase [Lentilactobacillus senioris]|uniref:RluA family pseudouridine synthase n=1 Tax=Lentilactobacillus senioris TaxID=931534 RepID=UPI002281A7B2|nr:RluA family pseudouridine synthase [Lentilactobacillus senioris]MCY9806598.1 RluA family pseudouridine synthase [Lentilactobacillus senioris]
MKFTWLNTTSEPISTKRFLNQQGISHRMYSELKELPGAILVDGKQQAEVPINAEVQVNFPDEISDPRVMIDTEPIQVVFEDDNWLVVNKTAGISSVPGPSDRQTTLVNKIKGHWQQADSPNLVPHIITRLDRDTSGAVLVAHNRLANSLANQLQENHEIQKQYLAVVSGTGLAEHDLIDLPLAKNPMGYDQLVTPTGKKALTEYWKLTEVDGNTILKIQLHTGRTHQIRAHFRHLGHPLVGDELYRGPLNQGLTRQALHAATLQFIDPFTDQTQRLVASLPTDLTNYFERNQLSVADLLTRFTDSQKG